MRIAVFGDVHGHWCDFRDAVVQLNSRAPLDLVLQYGDAQPIRNEDDLEYMHCPEKWGYVQFSEARAGKAKYLPDPSAAVRNLLHRIYYAQKDYRQKHGSWAATLAELGLEDIECKSVLGAPEMQVTQNGFEIVAAAKCPDGKTIKWHIRQDSRVWMSESVAVKEQ